MQSLIQRYHDELYFTAMTSSGRHWTLTKVLHTILCFMFITQKSHFCPVYIRHLSHLNSVILTGFLSPESAGGSFVSDWVLESTLPATYTAFAVVECCWPVTGTSTRASGPTPATWCWAKWLQGALLEFSESWVLFLSFLCLWVFTPLSFLVLSMENESFSQLYDEYEFT